MYRTSVLIASLLAIAACGGTDRPAPVAAPTAAASEAPGDRAAAPRFENPGGMWMPSQLTDDTHATALAALGLEITPEQLADPTSAPLAAVVSLGGCSASFVSPDGLIVTNHHCVRSALQYHSTPEDNVDLNGFLARSRAEERWNGPTARVYVTRKTTDVTSTILAGLEAIDDSRARYKEIESREKALVADCEKDRPEVRCQVSSFFRGAEFQLIEKLQISDVRLVYAPARGIGWFGGDEDNWMWPRHTGDFAFYRAYVGKDGKPAEHADDNVPYRPAHYLPLASKPLAAGDLVMVAGYPGITYRHRTAAEVEDKVNWSYPRSIQLYTDYIAALEEVGARDEDAKIKATPWIMGLGNGLKNNRGMMDGLVKGGLAGKKAAIESELTAWIEADPARKERYGKVLAEMAALDADYRATRERDAAFAELGFSSMLGAARTIVRMAEERPKADADRDPSFQERNWQRLEASQKALLRRYNRELDKALLTLAVRRAARQAEVNADWMTPVMGKGPYTSERIGAAVDRLYADSKLESEELRLRLLTTATSKSLGVSRDPFIKLALALRPLEKAMEERAERHEGAMTTLRPRYIEALRAFDSGPFAPDANGTLRVTYGTVRGYRPTPETALYEPFTGLAGVVAKHRDAEPFDVPDALLAAARANKLGPYVDATLGDVPVNFLSDLDITGGNSGSATLNGKGELVGLVFDGNYESMASDWLFIPELTRSIHVDLRYILWIMDAVDGADHLLRELGAKPVID